MGPSSGCVASVSDSSTRSALLAGAPAAHDQGITGLALARAALRLALRVDRVTTTRGLPLTTAVRVVHRVHGDTTDGRALALPPHPACLAPVDVRLLGVTHLADGGAAAHVDVADLARRHAQLRQPALTGDELDAGAGRAGDLRPAARTQLDGMNHGADGDVPQRQVVARLDVGRGTALDGVALLQPGRRQDVALLAVGEVQQRDPRGAVRVVLDVRDLGRHAVLVGPTEVDHPVGALVPAALVPSGHLAVDVASTATVQRANQRLLRVVTGDLGEVGHARATAPRRRRLVLADSHLTESLILCPGPGRLRRPDPRRSRCGRRGPATRWRAWCPCACPSGSPGCACACPGG